MKIALICLGNLEKDRGNLEVDLPVLSRKRRCPARLEMAKQLVTILPQPVRFIGSTIMKLLTL